LPRTASEVDSELPFSPDELLYRRVGPEDINSMGEVRPSSITDFTANVRSSPSVLRSHFCEPGDVLHFLCAEKDTAGWLVYFVRVDCLPAPLISGDNRTFQFFPLPMPLPNCGAHSVIASCDANDTSRAYSKPSGRVGKNFKVKLAVSLKPVEHVFVSAH
jgi:hypothetical protein